MESNAKPYMRKGFLIYEEMRKYFTIYEDEALHPITPNFLIYEKKFSFLFYQCSLALQLFLSGQTLDHSTFNNYITYSMRYKGQPLISATKVGHLLPIRHCPMTRLPTRKIQSPRNRPEVKAILSFTLKVKSFRQLSDFISQFQANLLFNHLPLFRSI
jgi:hypothetical protein